jgi:hypothetical protein
MRRPHLCSLFLVPLILVAFPFFSGCNSGEGNSNSFSFIDAARNSTIIEGVQRMRMRKAIKRGLNYIYKSATCEKRGAPIYICDNTPPDTKMICETNCNMIYVDDLIILNLLPVDYNPQVAKPILEATLNGRHTQDFDGGFFDPWGNGYSIADLDTTGVALLALNKTGTRLNMVDQIMALRTEEGLFKTLVTNTYGNRPDNKVDCQAQASLHAYLVSEGVELDSICNYLNNPELDFNKCDVYYNDYVVWFFMSKAFDLGSDCLNASRDRIIKTILHRQKPDGGWDSPNLSAFHAATLANYHYQGPEIKTMIDYLLRVQKSDGSWQWGEDYHNDAYLDPDPPLAIFGSEAWTTTLAVYALHYYLNHPGENYPKPGTVTPNR